MEKEKLNEELTEEVAGGAKGDTTLESQIKELREKVEANKISVKCAKCGKEFKYYKYEPGSISMKLSGPHGFWAWDAKRRTCPNCGCVNSEKELGI